MNMRCVNVNCNYKATHSIEEISYPVVCIQHKAMLKEMKIKFQFKTINNKNFHEYLLELLFPEIYEELYHTISYIKYCRCCKKKIFMCGVISSDINCQDCQNKYDELYELHKTELDSLSSSNHITIKDKHYVFI